MSYKQIALISDNPTQFKRVVGVFQNLNICLKTFTSPLSNAENFDIIGFPKTEIIDLKKQEDIEKLIEFFDLIISIHCKQLFPAELVKKRKCINIHPGYNPVNRGWYPQVFAILNDLDVGATIHEMDELLDHGRIIARKKIVKKGYDTSLSLYNRILDAEIELVNEFLPLILEGNFQSFNPENEGNLFLKQDFNSLLEIDLNERVTFKQAIDRLRALTHGNYNNAYFFDEHKNKIFVSINLELAKNE